MIEEKYRADGVMCAMQALTETSTVWIIIGKPHCDIVGYPRIAYGFTKVASKLELQALSIL